MRILVYGVGAVGSAYASRLKTAGYDVTALARGKRYDNLKHNGLIVEDAITGERTTTQLNVIKKLKPIDLYDYIFVCVRKTQLSPILPILANNLSPTIIFLMNNLSGPSKLIKAIGKNRVILGFPSVGGKMEKGVAVITVSKINIDIISTTLGELDGEKSERLLRIVKVLKSTGFYVRVSNRIVDWLMTHGVFVVLGARALAKNNYNIYQLANSTKDIKKAIHSIRAGFRVLVALGYKITPTKYRILFLPTFILVPIFQLILNSKLAEVTMAWYCRDAPEEFRQLEKELLVLTNKLNYS